MFQLKTEDCASLLSPLTLTRLQNHSLLLIVLYLFNDKLNNDKQFIKMCFLGFGVKVREFFQCFSLIKNTSCILDTKVPPGAITSINGLRVLSMWWVILGHVFIWQMISGNVSKL